LQKTFFEQTLNINFRNSKTFRAKHLLKVDLQCLKLWHLWPTYMRRRAAWRPKWAPLWQIVVIILMHKTKIGKNEVTTGTCP